MSVQESQAASGLTFRVVLAAIFASLALMPVAIWMNLIGGAAGGLAFTTILLFNFVLRSFGGRFLSSQEIYLMNLAISLSAYNVFFFQFIYRVYFANSPEAMAFGITEYLPEWWVPSNPLIRQQMIRTFLHPEWFVPILVSIVLGVILPLVIELPLGYLAYQMYVIEEKLPFPFARVDAEIAVTLGEREHEKMRAMVLGFIAAFVYALLVYTPYILGSTMGGRVVTLIPVPFIDLSVGAESLLGLPGTLLGIATDLFTFFAGLILPTFNVVLMLIGSIAVWVIGNSLLLSYFRDLVPEWTPGFNITLNWQFTYLHVWSSVFVGLTFAIMVVELTRIGRFLKGAFSTLGGSARGNAPVGLSYWKLLTIYFLGAIAWTASLALLLPAFPVLPLTLLTVFWPLFSTLINARGVGETGYSVAQIPLREIVLITTQTSANIPVHSQLGVSAWLAPMPGDGVTWCTRFYVARYIGLKLRDVVLTVAAIAIPLSLVMSFIHTSIIWLFGPIPSQAYPWAQASWPINVIQSCLWITRGTAFQSILLNPGQSYPILEAAFMLGVLLHFVTKILHIPFSLVIFAVGASTIPPYAISIAIGHVIYRILIRFRRETVERLKWSVYAGAVVGYGVATSLLISFAIMVKSTWLAPY